MEFTSARFRGVHHLDLADAPFQGFHESHHDPWWKSHIVTHFLLPAACCLLLAGGLCSLVIWRRKKPGEQKEKIYC